MAYKRLSFQIQGIAPLLMHAPNAADPLNEFSKMLKQVSKKRGKTEADFVRMAEIEYKAGLYMSRKGPILTPDVILATLTNAAKKSKRGNDAKAGLFVEQAAELQYDGPRDADRLWADPAFRLTCGVKIGKARVMRTRPMFREWSATITVTFDDSIFNSDEIKPIVVQAGEEVGFCDWRPRYGRFKVLKAI